MSVPTLEDLRYLLRNLRNNKDMSYAVMEEAFVLIRQAITKEKYIWKDLGTDKDELADLELSCFSFQLKTVVGARTKARNYVKGLASSFRAGAYNDNSVRKEKVVNIIKQAIGMNLLTWNDLGLTPEFLADTLTKITQ